MSAAQEPAHKTGYIHGYAQEERERLSTLNGMLNAHCLALLDLAPGERVLDVGSGLGQMACAMARAVGDSGAVVGVERDEGQIEVARAGVAGDEGVSGGGSVGGSVEFRAGDATAPPLTDDEWGSFDAANCRFLLEHVADPGGVLEQIGRALKPGGRVLLVDDDHELFRVWPEAPALMRAWRAYIEAWGGGDEGADARIGRKLGWLLAQRGFTGVRIGEIPFSACKGEPLFRMYVQNWEGLLVGARRAMLGAGAIDGAGFDAAVSELSEWAERDGASFWFSFSWALGRRA